jgi:DNA-directed RNA polymerase specialized sigma24 family protein
MSFWFGTIETHILINLAVRAKVNSILQNAAKKKDWIQTPEAFQKLLEWLDEGSDTGGEKYLEMRRRLVVYFDRKNCRAPDELADETLNRVARRLEEEGKIDSETPAKFCYITARFVFMESLRGIKSETSLDEVLYNQPDKSSDEKEFKDKKETMLNCLDKCTGKLEAVNRELIVKYYFGQEREKIENRRRLAENLGISVNALSIRACRIREKLEICVKNCAKNE